MVGVVGMGHVPGIVSNWNKDIDIKSLVRYSAVDHTSSFQMFMCCL